MDSRRVHSKNIHADLMLASFKKCMKIYGYCGRSYLSKLMCRLLICWLHHTENTYGLWMKETWQFTQFTQFTHFSLILPTFLFFILPLNGSDLSYVTIGYMSERTTSIIYLVKWNFGTTVRSVRPLQELFDFKMGESVVLMGLRVKTLQTMVLSNGCWSHKRDALTHVLLTRSR